jgi:hypothetical protein
MMATTDARINTIWTQAQTQEVEGSDLNQRLGLYKTCFAVGVHMNWPIQKKITVEKSQSVYPE